MRVCGFLPLHTRGLLYLQAAIVLAFRDPRCFSPDGFAVETKGRFSVVDGDVVCEHPLPCL